MQRGHCLPSVRSGKASGRGGSSFTITAAGNLRGMRSRFTVSRFQHSASHSSAAWIGDERLSFEERTCKYCGPAVMYDYFDREHLEEMKENEKHNLSHPKCKEEGAKVKHLDYFGADVMSCHGVSLRRSDQVKSFTKASRRLLSVFADSLIQLSIGLCEKYSPPPNYFRLAAIAWESRVTSDIENPMSALHRG
jgi:hypothetical protein